MRLWRMLRTALRPLPRPGVVLIEDFGRAGDTSSLPDPCDCDAWGTDGEHRPETWTHSGDFVPDFKVRHPACPRWRPTPRSTAAHFRNTYTPRRAMCDCTGAPHAEEPDCPRAGEAAILARMGPTTDEERATFRMAGMAMPRPEMAAVVRSPRSEYRRPVSTPVPGGGTKRHA